MRYLDEFRDPAAAAALVARIRATVTRPWTVMEVCGGQTHALIRSGVDQLLPPQLQVVHGPGCPVCVTPASVLDRAARLAAAPGVTLATFGDMLRVPGTGTDLARVRAAGGDVAVVYSPLDAVSLAARRPDREVVFLAVGFESTAPATALAVLQAEHLGLTNFSVLSAHVRVVPAMEAILADPGNRVRGFLAAGHVCAVTGFREYHPLVDRYRVPVVATGFEPLDLLEGIALLVDQLESGRATLQNQYARAVRPEGNPHAAAAVARVYEVCDREWRGLGVIPAGGLRLLARFRGFDAEARFPDVGCSHPPPAECPAGLVLQGRLAPDRCPAYGTRCTPDRPLGALMVSSEGACAAYWHAGRPPRGVPLEVLP